MKQTLFYFALLLFITGCTQQKPKDVTVIFRYDDPSVYTSDTIEKKVLELFTKYEVPITFAVIPYRCEGDPIDTKIQKVKELPLKKVKLFTPYIEKNILTIAQHGYSHQSHLTHIWSEFIDMPYDEQVAKIAKGKNLLENRLHVKIHSFVPSYNTYDMQTVKALENLGFSTLSANSEVASVANSKLRFLSNTITIDKLKDAISEAHYSSDISPTVVVIFHEYNFMKTKTKGINKPELSFKDLDLLLLWLKKQNFIHFTTLE